MSITIAALLPCTECCTRFASPRRTVAHAKRVACAAVFHVYEQNNSRSNYNMHHIRQKCEKHLMLECAKSVYLCENYVFAPRPCSQGAHRARLAITERANYGSRSRSALYDSLHPAGPSLSGHCRGFFWRNRE